MQQNAQRPLLGYTLGTIAVILFGITLPVTHMIVDVFSTLFITATRVTVAGLLACALWFVMRFPPPQKKQLRDLALIAFGLCFGFPFGMTWAMLLVPASHGGVVLALLPITTTLYATFLTREKPSITFWGIAILGSVSTIGYSSVSSGAQEVYLGDLLLLFAIVTASLSYALSARLTQQGMPGWQVISWVMILTLPISTPIMLFSWPETTQLMPQIADWTCLLYLAAFSQYLAFFAWNKGLAIGGISHVSQVQLLQPFITIIGAWVLYREHIDILTIVFAVYIVGLVALSKKAKVTLTQV